MPKGTAQSQVYVNVKKGCAASPRRGVIGFEISLGATSVYVEYIGDTARTIKDMNLGENDVIQTHCGYRTREYQDKNGVTRYSTELQGRDLLTLYQPDRVF